MATHWKPDRPVRTGQPVLDKALAILFRWGWHLQDAQLRSEFYGLTQLDLRLTSDRGDVEVSTGLDRDGAAYDTVLRVVETLEIGEIVRERPDLMAEVENELALRALARLGTPS